MGRLMASRAVLEVGRVALPGSGGLGWGSDLLGQGRTCRMWGWLERQFDLPMPRGPVLLASLP